MPRWNPITQLTPVEAWWAEGADFVATNPVNGSAIAHPMPGEGSGNHGLGQVTPAEASRPIYVAASGLNGKPALRWDGGDHLTNNYSGGGADWTAIPQPLTVVCIFKLNSIAQGTIDAVFGSRANLVRHDLFTNTTPTPDSWSIHAGTQVNATTPAADLLPHIAICEYNGASSKLILDGVEVLTGNAGTNSSTGMQWGALQSLFPAQMDSPILLLEPRILTAGEKASLLQMAQDYYGVA